MHYGIDIGVSAGTPIGALDDGEVMFVGTQRSESGAITGAGNYVTVRYGTEENGFTYSSAFHIQEGGFRVEVGDRVSQGDTIGLVGSTGMSTNPHLHLEYFEGGDEDAIRAGRIGSSGARRLNPSDYIGRDGYLDRITIRSGDVNDAVERLQERLSAMGYDIGEAGVDRAFGEDTQRAVAAFQRDRGLPENQQQGIYGPITRAEMADAERTNFRRPGAPSASVPDPSPEQPAPIEAPAPPASNPPVSQRPDAGTGAFVDTPGPFASTSMGALLGADSGTPMGALTADQSYALGRAVLGDSVGADAFERVDRELGNGSGVFVTRMIALGRHEGALDFGRQNPDPASGYNYGTFQIGGANSTPAQSEARFARMLDHGIEVYETRLGGPTVDRDALTLADRDALAHIGYMADRTQSAFRTPLPEFDILERMADPSVQGADLVQLVHNDVQGGIEEIGTNVNAMMNPRSGLRVDLATVEARAGEPPALRAEPAMPTFSQNSATPNSDRGATYSPAVQAWQGVLQARGLDIGAAAPDGVYGVSTRRSTEALQREAGLPARGVVGPATWAAYGDTGAQRLDGQPAEAPEQPAQPASDQGAQVPGGDGASVGAPVPAYGPPGSPDAVFLREADHMIDNVLDRHTRDIAGARQALVDGTYGPGSGPLGATTAEDVQAAFDRFSSGDAEARPLSRTEAAALAPVLDARARLVAEGVRPAPVEARISGDGASVQLQEPARVSPEPAGARPDATGLRQTGPTF